jgi:hypothetical protein
VMLVIILDLSYATLYLGGLELLVQFEEFMYPKLGMIHDFHFVWILRALSFKVT